MKHYTTCLTKTMFVATCLALGCSSSGTLGCGSSESAVKVDSELLGVYRIDTYQGTSEADTSAEVCEHLGDLPATDFVVLYSVRPISDPDTPLLVGTFCSDLEQCQQLAREATEPTVGYAFRQGSDQAGWVGWGISDTGAANDQCRADVQVHTLSSAESDAIRIDTETFETVYAPTYDGNQATCSIRDAIDSLTPDLPCKARFLLEGTREASL